MSGFMNGTEAVPLAWLKILLLAHKGNRPLGYAELADCVLPDAGKLPPGSRGSKMHRSIRRMEAEGLVVVDSQFVRNKMRPVLSVTALGHAILDDFAEFFVE